MDEKTKEALIGSIEKWEKIVAGTGMDKGATNCPLCHKFMTYDEIPPNPNWIACNGCPVQAHSEEPYCKETPYKEWRKHVDKVHIEFGGARTEGAIHCPRCKELARKELDFLKSLLPQ